MTGARVEKTWREPGEKLPVAVLGATGMVGQRFIELLQNHPWFELVGLAASGQHKGRPYREVARWRLPGSDLPSGVAELPVVACDPGVLPEIKIAFSALPAEAAGPIEAEFARAGVAVFSNARSYRMEEDVPLIIPEVNPAHTEAILTQRKARGWSGSIVTNPNCSATPLAMALKPLQLAFGVEKVLLTTLQAISGAGYPGLAAYDMVDNVVPYISGEEEKLESETQKMLGSWKEGEGFHADPLVISAHCTRVPVREGHLECVSVGLKRSATLDEMIAVWRDYQPEPQLRALPSAPRPPLLYRDEPDRPQTLRDRDAGGGMAVTIGRLRPCPLLGYKFVLLAHNTIRGAAGGSLLNAELCVSQDLL